jgi:integrative and conjugative element protein (TIGR02256 family)
MRLHVIEAWIRTSGTLDYLGEWHTHPEDTPRPSSIDRQQWHTVCDSTTVAIAFVIVGRADCSVPLSELVGTSAKSDYVYFARH